MHESPIDHYLPPSECVGTTNDAERFRAWDEASALKQERHAVALTVDDLIVEYAHDVAYRYFTKVPITPAYMRDKLQSFLRKVDDMRKVEQCTQS